MIKPVQITWGSDPEAFFSRNGAVIGSERIIPKKGVTAGNYGKVIRDGVQFELNPVAGTVSVLKRNVKKLLDVATSLGDKRGAQINFDTLVEVSQNELDTLSLRSRVLGCMPSFNFYGEQGIAVDPHTYRKRSSGGHIHMGIHNVVLKKHADKIIPIMDIIVGNTCVLLDHDPGARERRENYGRAGEYRLPTYGLEYRTTSNFWLKHLQLMPFVFGLAHMALSIRAAVLKDFGVWKQLLNNVSIDNVRYAINTNNHRIALDNYIALCSFLETHFSIETKEFPLHKGNLNQFETFAKRALEDPTHIQHWDM